MTDAFDRHEPLPSAPPPLAQLAHKGDAGRVLCLAGCETMPGAAILVLRAAQRAGAGLVTLATFDKAAIHATAVAVPEAVYLDLSRTKDLIAGRLPTQLSGRDDDVRVAGPGLGRGGRTNELIRRLVSDDFTGPLVLDADGLNVIQDTPEVLAACNGALVVTPHPGEAARLLGMSSIPSNDEGRSDCARQIARAASAICVLKGHHTVVTDGGRTWINPTGNPGMATAGSGDVLCGVLGAYLASSVQARLPEWSVFEAVRSAVWVHGRAGDLAAEELGCRSVIASSIVDFLCRAQCELSSTGARS
jgi:NAD(P)H-hydrate epimerase